MRIITFIFLLFASQVKAQYISSELISSGGDLFKSSSFQMEWTIGDLATETYQNSSYVTQGFLQGSLSAVVGQKEISLVNKFQNIIAYPNPFNNGFNLELLNTKSTENVTVTIYDMLGKVVYKNNNADAIQFINMEHLASGVYIVGVKVNNEPFGNLKVNKI